MNVRTASLFFQSYQPDSRPAEEIDFGRLKAWTAGGRMGTSVGDTATFSLFIAGCLKVEPHEIHDLFSLSLYIYLSVYSPVMFLVSD